MKRILYSICIGTLALAVTAWGEQVTGEAKGKAKTKSSRSMSAVHQNVATRSNGRTMSHNVGQANTRLSMSTQLHQSSDTAHGNAIVHRRSTNLDSNARFTARERNVRTGGEVRTRDNVTINREGNITANRRTNTTFNGGQKFAGNRGSNIIVNNTWRGQQFSGQNYAAFYNYSRTYHDRTWWRSQSDQIIFVSGGWYFLNAGYWYPAWGYNRGYNYPYDGPIYGYNNLTPDRVVINVQEQLRRDGYYAGRADGVLGRMTRQALGAFQADHGLAVTSAVDEPTLAALRLV